MTELEKLSDFFGLLQCLWETKEGALMHKTEMVILSTPLFEFYLVVLFGLVGFRKRQKSFELLAVCQQPLPNLSTTSSS